MKRGKTAVCKSISSSRSTNLPNMEKVQCPNCLKYITKANIARHRRESCVGTQLTPNNPVNQSVPPNAPAPAMAMNPVDQANAPAPAMAMNPLDQVNAPASAMAINPVDQVNAPVPAMAMNPVDQANVPVPAIAMNPLDQANAPAPAMAMNPVDQANAPAPAMAMNPVDQTNAPAPCVPENCSSAVPNLRVPEDTSNLSVALQPLTPYHKNKPNDGSSTKRSGVQAEVQRRKVHTEFREPK